MLSLLLCWLLSLLYHQLLHLPLLCLLLLVLFAQQHLLLLVLHPAMPAPWSALLPLAVLLSSQDTSTASDALSCYAAAAIVKSMHVAADCLLLLCNKSQCCHCIVEGSNRKSSNITNHAV
jgi:hypothetical protein